MFADNDNHAITDGHSKAVSTSFVESFMIQLTMIYTLR